MREKTKVKISVRNLVEFVLRCGDLVSTFIGSSRNVDAIKAHQKIQKSAPKEYESEVMLSYVVEDENIILEIGGRADGIIKKEHEVIIDEIKTTTRPLEFLERDYNPLHWAQAKCYAFIYANEEKLDNIYVQLTYYNMNTKEIKRFKENFKVDELECFFENLVSRYLNWAISLKNWQDCRNNSIDKLKFPFPNYRTGQRDLAVVVYKAIANEKSAFIQAPTGIGKTMATLFPSIKAMGMGLTFKIFYLTAKTVTRTVAEKALSTMRSGGLKIKSVTITAKEKICFKDDTVCDAEVCEFAKGYFDRINAAIKDIFSKDDFSKDTIEEYALKHKVCPFQFSLELANFSDCIICDYNYVFDPRVYLKNLFQDTNSDFVFLIDEAHNLVDRAREMFSCEISKKDILKLKKLTKDLAKDVSKVLNKLNSYMIEVKKNCEQNNNYYVDKNEPKDIIPILRQFIAKSERWILERKDSNKDLKDNIMEFYFKALDFIRTYEDYDDRYITYAQKCFHDTKLKMFCQDPSYLLKKVTERGKSSIFFSGTLLPLDYFVDILGGCANSYRIQLSSPFRDENLCVLIDGNISTSYKMREFTYDKVIEDISNMIRAKMGNYLVFFPSYKYMMKVYDGFCIKNPDVNTLCQTSMMSEDERKGFLEKFDEGDKETLVGFAVMGGIFSEGIDLDGDKLIGAIIVGVGLPQICLERDLIKEHFLHKKGRGFEYAYMYPGMNKVMQAAGRVIRTEKDKGVILLIDKRFLLHKYYKLFPKSWNRARAIKGEKEITEFAKKFWRQ